MLGVVGTGECERRQKLTKRYVDAFGVKKMLKRPRRMIVLLHVLHTRVYFSLYECIA